MEVERLSGVVQGRDVAMAGWGADAVVMSQGGGGLAILTSCVGYGVVRRDSVMYQCIKMARIEAS